jgi:hypothetical protein
VTLFSISFALNFFKFYNLVKGHFHWIIQDEADWPPLPVLPSYGRGREAPDGRFSSLIFGTNLTDVIITGNYIDNSIVRPSLNILLSLHFFFLTYWNLLIR